MSVEAEEILAKDMSFDVVEELKKITEKMYALVRNQKHIQIHQTWGEQKSKSNGVSKAVSHLEFHIPMSEILIPQDIPYEDVQSERYSLTFRK